MKRYLYAYETAVSFSEPVTGHSLLLRPLPSAGSYMDIEEEHLVLPPAFHVRRATDQLGNRIVYGLQRDAHSALAYVSTGIVSMHRYRVAADPLPLAVWLQPTPLTRLDEGQLLLPDSHPDALALCHEVHRLMEYAPGLTDMDTPASEVMRTRRGVCQDYAHLMTAQCRAHGIPARYVCGLLEGEGETHAWVEVYDSYGCWHGYDPTHDKEIEYGYIKLAHARDAAGCPVSRGLYAGGARQSTSIHVMMKEI